MAYLLSASLRSPILVEDFGLCLESLLAASVYAETGEMRDAALRQTGVPTMRVGADEIHLASCAFFAQPTSFGQETILRRRTREEIGPDFYAARRMRKQPATSKAQPKHAWHCEQGMGDFKALMNTYRTVSTSHLIWIAELEDPDRAVDRIYKLAFIGKRRGQGFGEIGQVTAREVNASPLLDGVGQPRRPMLLSTWNAMQGAESPVSVMPSAGYAHPSWANEPELCAMPPSPFINMESFGLLEEDGEVFFG